MTFWCHFEFLGSICLQCYTKLCTYVSLGYQQHSACELFKTENILIACVAALIFLQKKKFHGWQPWWHLLLWQWQWPWWSSWWCIGEGYPTFSVRKMPCLSTLKRCVCPCVCTQLFVMSNTPLNPETKKKTIFQHVHKMNLLFPSFRFFKYFTYLSHSVCLLHAPSVPAYTSQLDYLPGHAEAQPTWGELWPNQYHCRWNICGGRGPSGGSRNYLQPTARSHDQGEVEGIKAEKHRTLKRRCAGCSLGEWNSRHLPHSIPWGDYIKESNVGTGYLMFFVCCTVLMFTVLRCCGQLKEHGMSTGAGHTQVFIRPWWYKTLTHNFQNIDFIHVKHVKKRELHRSNVYTLML